jgi:Polyketide cyclase / dehydrase and lipid transport
MPHLEQRVVIDRTPEDIWEFMLNPFNSPRWFSDMLGVRWASRGDVGPGSVGNARMSIFGFETRLTFTFTEWAPPRTAAYTITGRPFRSASRRVTLSPVRDGTEVVFVTDFEPRHVFRLITPIIWPIMRRRWAARNERLKKLIEAETR